MTKTKLFILLVLSWFSFHVARAATVEPTEANIEQLLAEKEALKAGAKKIAAKTASPVVASEKAAGSEELKVEAPEQTASASAAVTVSDSAKESEIPVQLEVKKASAAESSPFGKMILGLLVVAGLAVAAWLGIRRYQFSNKGPGAQMQMKILTQHHLGPKKSLAVVRVAGESILIGVTDHHISMIKSLSLLDEEMPEEIPRNFDKIFKNNNREEPAIVAEEGEEFALGGIKDFVSTKLKNMRSFE